ncbi:armadillo repeat-containing protein 1-like [Harmonia axyridis]|uniref:armadillo repeat-containing protein 1-like n=1 Tax=Harmonia axyridis TaxID=115357 RepID=UPI001E275C07|nr:armadillo repeat-containing protein 1-like [Harmonia axyridis]
MSCQNNVEPENTPLQECLVTLKTYKLLSESPENHRALLQEKTPLLYPATLLEEKNPTIVNLSLDILQNLISNDENHRTILSTFGVYESLESLVVKERNKSSELSSRAEELVDILRSSAPPAFSTRSRSKMQNQKRNAVLLFQIEELKETNKKSLERVLVKTRGVISFLIDVEKKRCTIRLCRNTSIQSVAKKISEKCGMTAMVVTKDPNTREEVLKNPMSRKMEETMLEYYIDDEPPPGNTALTKTMDFVKKGNGLIKSVADFWNESFYW